MMGWRQRRRGPAQPPPRMVLVQPRRPARAVQGPRLTPAPPMRRGAPGGGAAPPPGGRPPPSPGGGGGAGRRRSGGGGRGWRGSGARGGGPVLAHSEVQVAQR